MLPIIAVSLVLSAPGPQPKALACRGLPTGIWIAATWEGEPWQVYLGADRGYHCHHLRLPWSGTWQWDRTSRRLVIREWMREPLLAAEHVFTLDARLRSTCPGSKIDLGGGR